MIDGERDPIRIQMVLAIEGRTIEKVHVKSGEEDHRPKYTSSESHSMPRHASSSADATTVISAVVASTPVPSSSPDLEATSGRGEPYSIPSIPVKVADQECHHAAVPDGLLGLHNPLGYLVTKHPKVMSTVSTALITVGSIVLLPGIATCAAGTIFAHPAATVVGAIAVTVGKWLRAAVHSAAAEVCQ
jgi:hypothetical protein